MPELQAQARLKDTLLCLHYLELQGKPVAVGGDVEQRHGIILAKYQLAKKFGVSTGEALWQAKQKCHDLVILPPRFRLYSRFSRLCRTIYNDYTLYVLAASVARWLREQGFKGRTVCISVRDNELFTFTGQHTLGSYISITGEIAAAGLELFRRRFRCTKPIRSIGISIPDLVADTIPSQASLFCDEQARERLEHLDRAVDALKKRFGTYVIQLAVLLSDRQLSRLDPKQDHTIHPVGHF